MDIDEHPLAYLLHQQGWSASDYLVRLGAVHQRLGYGPIARDRKRVTRWTRGGVTPDLHAQKAMAALHGIPEQEITARPWPEWLKLACVHDRQFLSAEWTLTATIELLDRVATTGGTMDRRGFLVVTGITPVLAGAATAQPAAARAHGRRVGADTPELFEQSLAILRRQDDVLGSGQVHASARAQLRLIVTTLRTTSYTEEIGRRLHGVAAEAARICAWTAYDSGRRGLAEEYYLVGLRAAASSGDQVVTANILAFWAMLRYATGDPRGASALVADALGRAERIGSPAMNAMLYARLARAHARAGDHRASDRAVNAAFDAYDRARDCASEEEPDCVYWLNLGELHMQAGSCELDLGRPGGALRHFTAASAGLRAFDAYREEDFPRSTAIFLAREAEARMALGDLDGAVDSARRSLDHLGDLSSARGTSSLTDLRARFAGHRAVPVVRDFLAQTA
ncbi:transcriptional regulator [Streptomyces qinzhouensis]|uniref:Transcriptional regulator n=1 Tax=Streptomyces qinzhouensis TaxID=2599401 RepID=A0A5B8J5K7_9ACTN|nr:transcriptional regulator [Streptomyces qinzhouensis]QDY76567.1 transcriptional regulator [Streptomyces qinzhouensis]